MLQSPLEIVFKFLLLSALMLSFYFFVDVLVFKRKRYKHVFSTWQFPMLLALFIDTLYY